MENADVSDKQHGPKQKVTRYQDLIAWQRAFVLAKLTYDVTERFPKHETYGLAQQMRRAAVSIPSNIAEGWGRSSRRDYLRFLDIARGSSYELQTQFLLAAELRYVNADHECFEVINETQRLLTRLIQSLTRQTP